MAPQSLSILCFGDSLTSGYHSYGLSESPYSDTLRDRLQAAMPDTQVRVFTNGEPGDVVSCHPFQQRLDKECQTRLYDWVIMLAGTNDLALVVPVPEIFDALKTSWNLSLSKGSKVLALTVPECLAKVEWLNNNRRELNRSILAHRQPNFYSFYLFPRIPYHSLSKQDRNTYWDDGLGLTADGYKWMGGHIADGLLRILTQQDQPEEVNSTN